MTYSSLTCFCFFANMSYAICDSLTCHCWLQFTELLVICWSHDILVLAYHMLITHLSLTRQSAVTYLSHSFCPELCISHLLSPATHMSVCCHLHVTHMSVCCHLHIQDLYFLMVCKTSFIIIVCCFSLPGNLQAEWHYQECWWLPAGNS